ncbi:tRNA (adenosine(37)-N6)-threonylcarbamoyltransferase complex ATPase subunit type 1 TsaE [Mycoplasma sp. Pen4]|uniref:tRNA (adenosine(37)-N6)-threonylcarbamoyltransferase complex ATPase subunit type 1 TsaE n=1 Tax=Mycoplasma sp. Pen4 TaxID=640330 RepID=UPI0016549342|nr:tRNA (adenosine(37)-N6)-threonylcarbamoyltransferase complex ATPase subunit type 1 TsaE [Mycoplasma sp. Pen4]QNM93948.1 tRNA (adenosine(37)-N6)-threonylcarbamoyltransferase complex ATPase subunit type 1 TsaE [Mycoplasma sp. Pen4]
MLKINCNSIDDLDKFIEANLNLFKEKQFVLLEGELGAGKTTFVKRLAKFIGISENITSPSFLYMKDYPGLIHIDLYNYKGSIEEFEDYFDDNIVAIEWPSKHNLDLDNFIKIKAYINENDQHCFEIEEVK